MVVIGVVCTPWSCRWKSFFSPLLSLISIPDQEPEGISLQAVLLLYTLNWPELPLLILKRWLYGMWMNMEFLWSTKTFERFLSSVIVSFKREISKELISRQVELRLNKAEKIADN